MDRLSSLTKQHRDIKEIVEKIKILSLKGKIIDEDRAKEIRKSLSQLAGKLKIHMQREDDFLYPDLLKSEKQDVKRITQKFINEMGNLSVVFEKFNKKYLRYTIITENTDNFIKELKIVLEKLEERVESEENKLYTLISE